MTELDKNMLLDLIHKYGVDELESVININKELLNYISETTSRYTINEQPRFFLYNEANNKQIFTNSRTSIFCLNNKILNFDKLKINLGTSSTQVTVAQPDELQKYFDKSEHYFKGWYSPATLTNDRGLVFHETNGTIETILYNEYKLLRLLLKTPKIFAAEKNSILYAESENGYAYVLGKRKGSQLIF